MSQTGIKMSHLTLDARCGQMARLPQLTVVGGEQSNSLELKGVNPLRLSSCPKYEQTCPIAG
jgi:hypothetical protein